jgi:hypothetical protein
VDKSAQRVRGDEPEQPQNQKNYRYCPKQVQLLSP